MYDLEQNAKPNDFVNQYLQNELAPIKVTLEMKLDQADASIQ